MTLFTTPPTLTSACRLLGVLAALLLFGSTAQAQLASVMFEAESGTLGDAFDTGMDGDTTYVFVTTNFTANTDTANVNGGFEATDAGAVTDLSGGVEGWGLTINEGAGAGGSFEIVSGDAAAEGDRALAVSVTGASTSPWHIEALATPVTVVPGTTYKYSIQARADMETATASLTVGNSSFQEYGRLEADLTTEWQEFTFEFTITDEETAIRAPIHFGYDNNIGSTIYVDSLLIQEANAGDASVPQSDARTVSYEVTFPAPGSYALYARVYAGPGGFNDDSFLLATELGDADPTVPEDWMVVNGLAAGGFTDPDAIVDGDNGGGNLFEAWKWVPFSAYGAPDSLYTVEAGALTQTFEIGGREDGLWFDKFAFAPTNFYYTVSGLENGEGGISNIPNDDPTVAASFEAESGMLGAEFGVGVEGDAFNQTTYAYAMTDFSAGTGDASVPQTDARTAMYRVQFPAAGTYDLYARVYVGAGADQDDSFLLGNGFGEKDPTLATDWLVVNQLDMSGYTEDGDVVTEEGTAGTEVWKWVNLSESPRANLPEDLFVVTENDLTQVIEIGGREDGLWFDQFAFAPSNLQYTVANLDSGESGLPVAGEEEPEAAFWMRALPNPVQASAEISFQIPSAANVLLQVYDVRGRLVQTLVEGLQPSGSRSVTFDASGLASGIYLYRLTTDDAVITKKLTVIR